MNVRRTAFLAALLATAACVTPQIPITPAFVQTSVIEATLDAATGQYRFSAHFDPSATSGPAPGDTLTIFDRSLGQGVVALVDGSWNLATSLLPVAAGDLIDVYYYDIDFDPPEESPHACTTFAGAGFLPPIDPTLVCP